MSDVSITLPDGSTRTVPAGSSVRDLATGISPRLAKASLAAVVDGRLVDLTYALTGDADYMVKLTVPDLKALSHILNDVFLPHESVAHVHSSIVLDRLKQSARLPLAHLARAQQGDTSPKRRRR